MSQAEGTAIIEGLADFFAKSMRTPILKQPHEYGLAYEDVFFPSFDGVALQGWFIPTDSDRLIICNHFMPGNRYGYPGHLMPWTGFGGFEVDFLPQYKALHDAGYNVLAYDLRNHGRSAAGKGGIVGIGLLEYPDVIGSVRYAKSRKDTAQMNTSLLSVCLGSNSTMVAMNKHPEEFTHIQSMLALQPVSARPFIERASERANIQDGVKLFDTAIFKRTGFHVDELSPIEYAKAVRVPTLVVQVHEDALTKPSDVQAIYNNISAKDKKLFWIEGTTRRFDGYNYLGAHPELMLGWFNSHSGLSRSFRAAPGQTGS
jgi:uncharacterized protein